MSPWLKWPLAVLIGAVLFVVFERKNISRWRAMRSEPFSVPRSTGPVHPSNRHPDAATNAALLARLESTGFLDELDDAEALQLRTDILAVGYGGVFAHPWRSIVADDEDLAEGFVEDFLKKCEPAFEHLRMPPIKGASRFEAGGAHLLELPGETLTLMTLAEAESERPNEKVGLSWGLVGARLFQIINARLQRAGKADRFYSVYGGNDGRVLVLTPAMYEAIVVTPDVLPSDRPYMRTDTWPDFGQPGSNR